MDSWRILWSVIGIGIRRKNIGLTGRSYCSHCELQTRSPWYLDSVTFIKDWLFFNDFMQKWLAKCHFKNVQNRFLSIPSNKDYSLLLEPTCFAGICITIPCYIMQMYMIDTMYHRVPINVWFNGNRKSSTSRPSACIKVGPKEYS